jgi:post-segregation antitoxin (ccd killing protein)
MRISVWVNDQLAARAKAKGLNLSALLRGALEEVLQGEAEAAEHLDAVSAYRIGDEVVIRVWDPR